MENENRKQFGCPIHDRVFLCRQDDEIICVAYGCEWKVPARRQTDTEIKTLGEVKKAFRE